MSAFKWSIALLVAIGAGALVGCNRAEEKLMPGADSVSTSSHSHDSWWCNEHGVPEEVCARCNSKLVADFKAKADWCSEHDRPESQCFICNPEREAEFAAQYEAKYGKKPPKPDHNEQEHAHQGHSHES